MESENIEGRSSTKESAADVISNGSKKTATPKDSAAKDSSFNAEQGSGQERFGQDRQNGMGGYGSRGSYDKNADRPKAGAMEVYVDNNIEKAMKVLKRKLIKEGLFKELKSRRYYEKPSEKKKRKQKEAVKKIRKEEARQKKNPFLFS